MKKRLTYLLLMLISISSCSHETEDFTNEQSITEADLFIASEKFQNYKNFIVDDAKMMKKIMKSLSKNKREKFNDLRSQASKCINPDEYNKLMEEINNILNIDYSARINKIAFAKYELYKNVNIPNAEILKAFQRYNSSNHENPITRSYEEQEYENCMKSCYSFYLSDVNLCIYAPYYGWDLTLPDEYQDYLDWCEYRRCIMDAEDNHYNCTQAC